MRKKLIHNLEVHLQRTLPNHGMKEAYEYAVLPPGKLFRPLLVAAVASDFKITTLDSPWENHSLLASFVEIHHAYTLIHDDLPCMDDDDMRRGKPSLHKKYGEWKAVLAGDGLLNVSYQLLSKMNGEQANDVFRLASWALGPKGLIHGQVMDLSEEMNESLESLEKTHELKTARLIQTSLAGSVLLIPNLSKAERFKQLKKMLRLGYNLGIAFQYLDDFTELTEELGEHEIKVNPWLTKKSLVAERLFQILDQIQNSLDKSELPMLSEVLGSYFAKVLTIAEDGLEELENRLLDKDLSNSILAKLRSLS